MSMIPTQDTIAPADARVVEARVENGRSRSGNAGDQPGLGRHFLEMLAVMMLGMVASAAIFLSVVHMSWDQATVRRPTASLLVIAAGMSVPMVAWMLHRGMGSRNAGEMAAVMVVPVIPFLCLVWFEVTKSALCGPYCLVTIAAMLALMLYRRDEYTTHQ
jgi:hypothetical protein